MVPNKNSSISSASRGGKNGTETYHFHRQPSKRHYTNLVPEPSLEVQNLFTTILISPSSSAQPLVTLCAFISLDIIRPGNKAERSCSPSGKSVLSPTVAFVPQGPTVWYSEYHSLSIGQTKSIAAVTFSAALPFRPNIDHIPEA